MFATACSPFEFDFDRAEFAGGVVIEAAPLVVFGVENEASSYRVAVSIADLFDAFLLRMDVEVVVATLPELLLVGSFELAGGELLEDLEKSGEGWGTRGFVFGLELLGGIRQFYFNHQSGLGDLCAEFLPPFAKMTCLTMARPRPELPRDEQKVLSKDLEAGDFTSAATTALHSLPEVSRRELTKVDLIAVRVVNGGERLAKRYAV